MSKTYKVRVNKKWVKDGKKYLLFGFSPNQYQAEHDKIISVYEINEYLYGIDVNGVEVRMAKEYFDTVDENIVKNLPPLGHIFSSGKDKFMFVYDSETKKYKELWRKSDDDWHVMRDTFNTYDANIFIEAYDNPYRRETLRYNGEFIFKQLINVKGGQKWKDKTGEYLVCEHVTERKFTLVHIKSGAFQYDCINVAKETIERIIEECGMMLINN